MNHNVFVSDGGIIGDKYKQKLKESGIPFEEGGHNFDILSNVGLVLKSPGVPEESAVMTKIRALGIKVISEIEFASLHYTGTVLAITGSNGKTTTSGLLYHLLKCAGLDVMLGGNYGDSFAGILCDHHPEYMVLEVSSFQLDDIDTFKPHVAVLLNITPDHLDRYEYKMEKYVASKFRINKNQKAEDYFIINGFDPEIEKYISEHSIYGNIITIEEENINQGILSKDGTKFELTIKGKHNLFNAACAVNACRLIGISEEQIAFGLKTFVNLPHRLETVAIIDGVEYINDSKATNVDSVFYALGAMDKPVVWIAGGTDKGNDYEPIASLVKDKVKAMVCMGIDNGKLIKYFEATVPVIHDCNTLDDAVNRAKSLASPGDVVLLSPACASFDLFKNYIDRGDKFKVKVLSFS